MTIDNPEWHTNVAIDATLLATTKTEISVGESTPHNMRKVKINEPIEAKRPIIAHKPLDKRRFLNRFSEGFVLLFNGVK